MAIGTGGAWKDNTSDFAKMYMNQPWTAEQDSPPVDLIPSEGQMTYEDNKHRIYYDGEWHDVEIGVDQGDQGSHNHTHWMSVEPNDHGNNGNNVTWTYSTADAEIEELKEIIKMLAELVKPYARLRS
jgi:threonyl-tRNA synthetase